MGTYRRRFDTADEAKEFVRLLEIGEQVEIEQPVGPLGELGPALLAPRVRLVGKRRRVNPTAGRGAGSS